jgi:hypothetical protein
MTKKHFIQLANKIRANNDLFTPEALKALADFCQSQNPNFNRQRWVDYIIGKCGKNGGKVKA